MHPTLVDVREFVRRHALPIIIVLLIVLLGAGYAMGYRPGPGLTLVRAGTLVLSNVPTGGTVYADQTKRAVSHGKDVRITLQPGGHSIIVDVKGDNPWNDVVNIAASQNTAVTPLLIPLSVKRVNLEDADETKANAALAAYTLPDEQHPLSAENGCANVSVSNNRIIASVATTTGCTPPPYLCVGGTCAATVIFSPIAKLHSVLLFPGRQDAIIVAYGDTVAVLEIDPLKPQYFAPLLKGGVAPFIAPWDAHSIVVHDDNRTFAVTF